MKSSRLLSILLLLQTHERMTSKELAGRLEVSARTILRDVEALSAAGVPVHTEQGRGGAIVLDRRARLDVARLDPAERQLLAVAGLDAHRLEQVGLKEVHSSAQHKLRAVALQGHEPTVMPLSEALLIDPSGWFTIGQEVGLSDLLDATREGRRIRLRYRRSGEDGGRWLTVDPYGMASKAGSWYLVADTEARPRMFNARRIQDHELLAEAAILRPGQDLRSVWQELVQGLQAAPGVEVHALLRSTRLDLAQRILGSRIVNIVPGTDGWAQITVRYPEIESVRQLLQFGDHVRILEPAEAVSRFHDIATQIMEAHSANNWTDSTHHHG